MYFNYHAKIKKLIRTGHLNGYRFVNDWNGISPALVFFFDNERPMPIRKTHWPEYMALLKKIRNSDK